ncbi:MAG TPA: AAA family ATPase [bacterium]|nr:AAA family ATPase [bacterium]
MTETSSTGADRLWRADGGLLCLVDVTGFTPLTEELTKLGPEGNEHLTGLLNAFFGALTEEVAEGGGHTLQFGGDAYWAYFQNADAGERACRRMLRRVAGLGEQMFGNRRYRLEADLVAAREMEFELWRVGPDRCHLVLIGDAVAKVSRTERLVGPGEYAVLHGGGRGTSGGDVAGFLSDRPAPPPHRAGLRPTTAVFALLPRSTTPDDLDELVIKAHRVCERHEALLAKIVPFDERQAVLALLGTPRAHDDDPRRGVNLALELVRDLGLTGAAVAGGYVYVGPVGGASAWEYTAIGDPVNLAARLLEAAGPGQVLVSEDTCRLCSADVNLELAWRKRVRGKAGEVTAWLALGSFGGLKPTRLRYELVGRREELSRVDRLLAKGSGVLYIMGDAGIGKSRLLTETENRARAAGYRTVAGQVDQMHRDFGLLQSIFENLAGVLETDTPTSTTEKLDALFEDKLPEKSVLDRRRWRTVIGALVFHLESEHRVISGYAPEVVQNSLVESIADLMKKLAGDGLFLAVDDLHLADESSCAMLEAALKACGGTDGPVLVASARGEGRFAEIARRPFFSLGAEEMVLGELGDEVWHIGDELLDGLPLEEEIRLWVLEQAQGNPFFLEQLVLDLIERGFIVRRGDRWVAGGGYIPERLPVNVFATILARVDRLSPASAEILRVASVIGQRFDERLIEALLPGRLEALGEAVTAPAGKSAGLAVRDSREELAYLFRHSLVREVTYRSLLVEQRKKLHHDVARAMVDMEKPPGEIAVHFERAGCLPEAAGYFLKSAESKKNYGSYAQAQNEARRALEIAREINDPVLANLARLALADFLSLLGRSDESLPLLEETFASSMELHESCLAVKVCRLAVQSLLRLGQIPEISGWVERAEEAAGDDPFLEISIAPIRSYPDMFAQRFDEAAKIVERAAALLPDPRTDEEIRAMAFVHGNLAVLYGNLHRMEEAEHQFRRAIELAERTDDRSLTLDNQLNLSSVLAAESRLDEALAILHRCAEEYEAMGYHPGLSLALFNLAQIEVRSNDGEGAIRDFGKSLHFARRTKNIPRVARTASLLGYHLVRIGRPEEAGELLDETLRLYEEHDFDNQKGLVYAIRAYYDARTGDAESARRFMRLAEENPVPDSQPPQDEVMNLARAELGGADDA